MDRPILNALKQLLTFKNYTTVPELSKVAGKKQLEVLTILNQNESLVKKDKKNGHIFGFHDVQGIQRAEAFAKGFTYKSELWNYGAVNRLSTNFKNDKVNELRESYISGFFGDSSRDEIIIDKPENRAALESLGVVEHEKYHVKTIENLWKE